MSCRPGKGVGYISGCRYWGGENVGDRGGNNGAVGLYVGDGADLDRRGGEVGVGVNVGDDGDGADRDSTGGETGV